MLSSFSCPPRWRRAFSLLVLLGLPWATACTTQTQPATATQPAKSPSTRRATFALQAKVFTTGNSSTPNVAVADVNGDGKPDVLVANFGNNSLGILLGDGAGSFTNQPNSFTGAGTFPESVAVADVNGDGKPDALTANLSTSTLGVLLGDGAGGFTLQAHSPSTGVNSRPRSVVIADVNGDGKLDALTTADNTSPLAVLLGDGAGGFALQASPPSMKPGHGPASIAVADVNADGKPDVVAFNLGTRTLDVLLGNGAGGFATQATSSATGNPMFINATVAADVNGDGERDLLVVNLGHSELSVLLGDGTGSFTLQADPVSTGRGTGPRNLVVADLNADGKPDVVTANDDGTLAVLLNTTALPGAGSRPPAVAASAAVGSNQAGVMVADVNDDGKPDALVSNHGITSLGVLLGNGAGRFTLQLTGSYVGGYEPQSVAVADVNADGKPDALTANSGSGTMGVLLGNGTGGFTAQANAPDAGGSDPQPWDVVVADVNGDGKPDALMANFTAESTMGVLLGDGAGGFVMDIYYYMGDGSYATSLAVADVNADGKPDALVSLHGTNTLAVLLGDGAGRFAWQAPLPATGGDSPIGIAAADVNGDGKPDVLIANQNSSTLGVLLGNGKGGFALQANSPSTGLNSSPRSVAVADVNGDGKPDVLTTNSGTNSLGVLLGDGRGHFVLQANAPSTGALSGPEDLAIADVNGDHKLDVLTANAGNHTLGVLLGDGKGHFVRQANAPSTGVDDPCRSVAVADVNGDGKPDALVANELDNTLSTLLGDGAGGFALHQFPAPEGPQPSPPKKGGQPKQPQ